MATELLKGESFMRGKFTIIMRKILEISNRCDFLLEGHSSDWL